MPEASLYCPKCGIEMLHEINADYRALCLGCYDIKDIRPKRQVQMETARRGKQEKRV